MRLSIQIGFCCLVFSLFSAFATEAEARALLQKANAALIATQDFEYSFHYQGDGSLQGHFTGHVWGQSGTSPMDHLYHVEMETHGENPDEQTDIWWMTLNKNRADLIDFSKKTHAFGHIDKGNAHLTTNMYYAVWFQFTNPNPFVNELKGAQLSLLPDRYVAGELCNGIRMDWPTSPYGHIDLSWYFAKTDHLPRAQTWKNRSPGQEGTFYFQVRELKTNSGITTSRFKASEIPGFEKVDEDRRTITLGQTAPNWTLEKLGGGELSLADYRGKLVILDFWASWCPPCEKIMPAIQEIKAEFSDQGIVVLGLNSWEKNPAKAKKFLTKLGIEMPVALGGERVANDYKVNTLPAVFALDKQGRFIFISNFLKDPQPFQSLRKAIKSSLNP